jgi:hypothetical protein
MTTATAAPATYAGTSTSWRLKDYAKVWAYNERVYIRWSDKLGLSIDGHTPERAKLLVQQVLAKGSIRPDLWQKHFYPDWRFGSVTYMD